jgi:hypothetical protein
MIRKCQANEVKAPQWQAPNTQQNKRWAKCTKKPPEFISQMEKTGNRLISCLIGA